MNRFFQFFLILAIPLLSVLAVSCGDDEDDPAPVVVPSITSVSPVEGLPGTVVTITGTNLEDVNAVRFGSMDAEGFNAANNTATTVTATVPAAAAAGVQTITVTSPDGSDTFDFTVLEEPVVAPVITSFDPMAGPVGTTITITGTGFAEENIESVMLGEMEVEEFSVADETSLSFNVPEGAETGTITITPVEGDAVVSIHSFTVSEPDPTATLVTHADVVVNAQGDRNDEGVVTAFSAEGETFTLAEGLEEANSTQIDFITADSGGDNKLDLFSPAGSDWLTGNYFEDADDMPVEWPVRNTTKLVLLEDMDEAFFTDATAADIQALTIGEEFENRIALDTEGPGAIILFETEDGKKGLLHFKDHDPNEEAGSKADIFTFDIKVLETE